MATYIIFYDIANPQRLRKVHRCTVQHARFMQYSVYCFECRLEQLEVLWQKLQVIIHPKEDDIRAYSVYAIKNATPLGQASNACSLV